VELAAGRRSSPDKAPPEVRCSFRAAAVRTSPVAASLSLLALVAPLEAAATSQSKADPVRWGEEAARCCCGEAKVKKSADRLICLLGRRFWAATSP